MLTSVSPSKNSVSIITLPLEGDRDGEGEREGDRDGEGEREGDRDGEGEREGDREEIEGERWRRR